MASTLPYARDRQMPYADVACLTSSVGGCHTVAALPCTIYLQVLALPDEIRNSKSISVRSDLHEEGEP